MKTSKTWSYEPTKRRYVANINKEKIVLLKGVGRTPENDEVADELYSQARQVADVQVTGDRTAVWVALKAWLDHLTNRPLKKVAPNTLARHERCIQSFIDLHGEVLGRDVRAWHIDDWLAKRQQPRPHPVHKQLVRWDEGSVKLGLGTMRTAFKWCVGRGLLTTNPFHQPDAQHLTEGPSINYEGKRLAIEKHEFNALLRLAVTRSSKDWAILLLLLNATGARPSELICARAEEWDRQNKAFVIRADEAANVGRFKLKRLKKNRVVYVRDDLVPFVELLIEKYRDSRGYPANYHQIVEARHNKKPEPKPLPDACFLFRKEKGRGAGQPMTIHSVNAHMKSSRKVANERAGREVVREGLTPYSFRHGYVTRWIVAGRNLKMLAQLLGTSVAMIEKHYSHLFTRHDVLRDHLNDFEAVERPGTT